MRVLIWAMFILFGGTSCLVENKTEDKFLKIGTDEHFFKNICGNNPSYRAWKKKMTYDYDKSETGRLGAHAVESEHWTHPNKQKLGTVSDMLGLQPYFDVHEAKLDLVFLEGIRHIWYTLHGRKSVYMNNKALLWFKANKKRVKCTGFQNYAPVFSFPVAGSDKNFEITSDDHGPETVSRWVFISPDDNTMTFISFFSSGQVRCIHGDDPGDHCHEAVLYHFDHTGSLHPNLLVNGKPQAINAIVRKDD